VAEKSDSDFIANSMLNPKVKEWLKSANIRQSYERKISLFFLTHSVSKTLSATSLLVTYAPERSNTVYMHHHTVCLLAELLDLSQLMFLLQLVEGFKTEMCETTYHKSNM